MHHIYIPHTSKKDWNRTLTLIVLFLGGGVTDDFCFLCMSFRVFGIFYNDLMNSNGIRNYYLSIRICLGKIEVSVAKLSTDS